MATILLDTHAWVWSRLNSPRLSSAARRAIEAAEEIIVSPVSLYEMTWKVRVGRWRELDGRLHHFHEQIASDTVRLAAVTAEVALAAASLEWAHRDPFDRILAATADLHDATILTADRAFHAPGAPQVRVVW